MLIYNLMGVSNFIAQLDPNNLAMMPETYQPIIENRPVWAMGAFALAVFGGALGCLLLLLKKPVAYYVFIASVIGAIVALIHTIAVVGLNFGSLQAMVGNLMQIFVTAFLIKYSKWAEREYYS